MDFTVDLVNSFIHRVRMRRRAAPPIEMRLGSGTVPPAGSKACRAMSYPRARGKAERAGLFAKLRVGHRPTIQGRSPWWVDRGEAAALRAGESARSAAERAATGVWGAAAAGSRGEAPSWAQRFFTSNLGLFLVTAFRY